MGESLTVMIVGAGAREHTISAAYEKSKRVGKIIVAPGNDFIAFKRKKEVVLEKSGNLKDANSFLEIAKKHRPDLIDVAQDDALAAGTVDLLQSHGFNVFGPKKSAARIEWDKKWSREFMQRHEIPMPEFQSFNSESEAMQYVNGLYSKNPARQVYVKAAGLCAGKGALKSENLEEAMQNIKQMKEFGSSGETFVIEDGLVGEEFSYYALSDGNSFHCFSSAQDNKRVFNFDEGDQTGGMGAVSPAKVTQEIAGQIETEQIAKAIEGMKKEGNPYVGVLYLGGIADNGKSMNIEYNARWGDPECQAVLPSVETDYAEIVLSCIEGNLANVKIKQDDKVRVCVVGASKGYPNDYSKVKGKQIFGLEDVLKCRDVHLFSAGIEVKDEKFFAKGGRLFSVVGEGENIVKARQAAYSAMALINIEGNNLHYRTDIGWRDVERHLKGK
ncbi:MAG: phosphoribosylamine--glycine ligase [Candidatus Diapherotrites archaeon]|nr:phosphoribosylamine--glycine ligase [Candidatus Diapherotrites archaeon]